MNTVGYQIPKATKVVDPGIVDLADLFEKLREINDKLSNSILTFYERNDLVIEHNYVVALIKQRIAEYKLS